MIIAFMWKSVEEQSTLYCTGVFGFAEREAKNSQLALYRFEKKFHKEITLNDDYETRSAIFNANDIRHFFNLLVII